MFYVFVMRVTARMDVVLAVCISDGSGRYHLRAIFCRNFVCTRYAP